MSRVFDVVWGMNIGMAISGFMAAALDDRLDGMPAAFLALFCALQCLAALYFLTNPPELPAPPRAPQEGKK